MNWDLITQGLELSVMGILTTFMALGLFIGTILLLRTVFPMEPRKKKTVITEEIAEAPAAPAEVYEVVDADDAAVAAISAAIYVKKMLAASSQGAAYVPRRTGLGARLEQPRSRWWQAVEYQED